MSVICGKGGKVMLGSNVIGDIKEWSIGGFTMGTLDTTAFGVTIKTFIPDCEGDPGTISFSGNYDPADQVSGFISALHTLLEAGTTTTELYLYANTSTFWRVGSGGTIITTKGKARYPARQWNRSGRVVNN